MSDLERKVIGVWRRELATVRRLLANIGEGRAPRDISPDEMEALKQDEERFARLIAEHHPDDGA